MHVLNSFTDIGFIACVAMRYLHFMYINVHKMYMYMYMYVSIVIWLLEGMLIPQLHSRINVDLINRCDKLINLFC